MLRGRGGGKGIDKTVTGRAMRLRIHRETSEVETDDCAEAETALVALPAEDNATDSSNIDKLAEVRREKGAKTEPNQLPTPSARITNLMCHMH